MNGKTPPPAAQTPPSVQRARQHATQGRRAWTGLWGKRIVGAALVLAALAVIGAKLAAQMQTKQAKRPQAESTLEPTWGRQTFQYKGEEPILPPPPKPPVDTVSPQLARMQADMTALRQELETLKSRKSTPAAGSTGGEKKAQAAAGPRATPAPLLFVAHDHKEEKGEKTDTTAAVRQVPQYVLDASTFLPCEVETKMNSEVEGYFTAIVTQNIYDSKTHRHLLIPQNSKILGQDNSSQLVYGNERMDTVSLKLTRPGGGGTVDLGHAPVMDQEGVAGLTGDVDQHYGRLLGAVFIGGALKGGMQAAQMAGAQAAGVGPVASGMATYGNQASSRMVGRALDTRPTIKVHAGQLCNVLLIKELKLSAMWE